MANLLYQCLKFQQTKKGVKRKAVKIKNIYCISCYLYVKHYVIFLARAEIARLIPTVADSKKEERVTSCLLASFMAVPDFARRSTFKRRGGSG
jgi:hypothetical protein